MSIGPCLCGAPDCDSCFPGNAYGQECENCGDDCEECECEGEASPVEPYDYADEIRDQRLDLARDRSSWGQGSYVDDGCGCVERLPEGSE